MNYDLEKRISEELTGVKEALKYLEQVHKSYEPNLCDTSDYKHKLDEAEF